MQQQTPSSRMVVAGERGEGFAYFPPLQFPASASSGMTIPTSNYVPANSFNSNFNGTTTIQEYHSINSANTTTNSAGANSQQVETDNSAKFHPIACEQCRKVHKFCTKVLPICDRCSEKGIPCEYKTPKRMRYHKNNQQQQTKKSKPSQLLNQKTPPQKLSKKEVIEHFFSLGMAIGIIDRQLLEDHILQRSDKKEIHALFYAIKGIVEQRFGISSAEASVKKARDLLASFFDSVDNFHVACTYSLLANYESGSGRRQLCKFYFGAAKCYVDGKREEDLNQYEISFKKGLFMMEIFLSNNEFCLSMMVKDFPKIFEYFTKEKLPPEISNALQQEITPDNYFEHLKLFEVVGTFIRKHIACPEKEEVDETKAKATELFKSIISNGVKISLLTRAGYEDCSIVEEAALKITFLTEQDLFSYFPVIVLTYVAMSARVHVKIVNKIEQGQRQNLLTGVTLDNTIVPIDYYQILEKDYKALKAMGKKYKKVEVDYKSILTEIEEILKRQENNTQFKTTPTNTSLESPITCDSSEVFDPFLTNEDMLQLFLQGASFQF